MPPKHDQPLRAQLHHIGLGIPDCEALADFYRRVMGLTLRPSGQGVYKTDLSAFQGTPEAVGSSACMSCRA